VNDSTPEIAPDKSLTTKTFKPCGMLVIASEQFPSGIKNKSAPEFFAAMSFRRIPPIGPTEPVGVIVPVPEM
jgi:hypothetical protein